MPPLAKPAPTVGPVVTRVKHYAYQAYESSVKIINDYLQPTDGSSSNYMRLRLDESDQPDGTRIVHSSRDPLSDGSMQRHDSGSAATQRRRAVAGAEGGVKKDD